MKIHESGENYLETILLLSKKNGSVRSIDIANELEYTKPSVSRAMGILKNASLIVVEKNGNIMLTDSGFEKAQEIYERHQTIKEFLTDILIVSSETAEKDACRIEHIISEETFNRIKDKLKKWIRTIWLGAKMLPAIFYFLIKYSIIVWPISIYRPVDFPVSSVYSFTPETGFELS